jgi:alpha-N-arabinofuranosidase
VSTIPTARVTATPDDVVGPVRRRTVGSFVEHLGRCVYGGIHEPGHPTADADGFRGDVLALVRELGVSIVRYPGGNFVSGYRWEDGIGPLDARPRRIDLAWHCTEPNTVGVDEFCRWAAGAGVEPMMAVNLGTRGIAEAVDLLEYCTVPGGTTLSDARRANGSPDPHRIPVWCLGNEMDGPWQLGHKTAAEYGRLAAETARAMRMVRPDLTLVACGSSGSQMATFGAWEREVLTASYDEVDLISAHAYYAERDGDLPGFLASALDVDDVVAQVTAIADEVGAARGSDKRIGISFDEWNVWYMDAAASQPPTGDDWPVAPPLLEDRYTVADAVVVGNLLMALLRNTDRVEAACLAQLVNVIAPIVTEPGGPAWRQTTFHPFALTARHAAGSVLRTSVEVGTYPAERFGEVPLVDAVVTYDEAVGSLVVLAVNRRTDGPVLLEVDLRGFAAVRLVEALHLASDDPYRRATADDEVAPEPDTSVQVVGGVLTAELPAVSWTIVRLAV